MIAIYTACFGGYDKPLEQCDQDTDVRWYAFTDSEDFPAPWRTIREPQLTSSARLDAKRYKCEPTKYLAEEHSIWIDANTEIISPAFAREALAAMHDNIALFAHPQRNCIYREAEASLRLARKKYQQQPIRAQVAHYRAEGYPARAGLFACGTIARRHTLPIVMFGHRWWTECVRWTYQDQLSFPVVARDLGIQPGVFPLEQIGDLDHFGNRWQTLHPHLSER